MAFVGKVEEDEKEDVEKLDFPAGKALHPCVVRSGGADGLRYTAHDGHVGYCFPSPAFKDAEFLTNAEVAILLEDRKKTAAAVATPTPYVLCPSVMRAV